MENEKIIIIDFGSQYTQLIARRVREANVFSEIIPPGKKVKLDTNVKGVILSGGPKSVYDKDSPRVDFDDLLNVPVLGICYGMQLMAENFNGNVMQSDKREYGKAILEVISDNPLFRDIDKTSSVLMSHSDKVVTLPNGFKSIAISGNTDNAAIMCAEKNMYGIQFHPEVVHTEFGSKIIHNFLYDICNTKGNWNPSNFINNVIEDIRAFAPDGNVISGVSGGVDSTVASELVHRAIGSRMNGFMIDTGLLRHNEGNETIKTLRSLLDMSIEYIDESNLFLSNLNNISDPETKRKIIGKTFIDVFEKAAGRVENVKYLVQGTIYPDRIESSSINGPSSTIKSHHNVGGLPERMHLKLIEPLKDLFKDEVRKVGKALNIPEELLKRHPFPGPGLAVRILGNIDRNNVNILQQADNIFISTIRKHGLYDDIWQAFAVFLPIRTVGVMGDNRTYENVIVLRAVTSVDGMTADWYDFPKQVLHETSTRIINEVNGVNRVVYDISTKPPSTIEWE